MTEILLGPSHELHVGVHGSLLENPPEGIRYIQKTYLIHFRYAHRPRAGVFDPFLDQSIGEGVSFEHSADSPIPVHTSRLPHLGASPWVTDADCLLGTLQFGSFFAIGSSEKIQSRRIDLHLLEARQRWMLRQYAGSSCRAVLLRTEYAKRRLLDHVRNAGFFSDRQFDAFADKVRVAYPAMRRSPGTNKRRGKRKAVSILYSGRTFLDKGGDVALAVFAHLRRSHGSNVTLTFVGDCPSDYLTVCDALGIRMMGVLPRGQYQELLEASDIFFSPTTFESFGMALLEAATWGLAIVTSSGKGMEHIGELFEEGRHALFVSNALLDADKVAAFTAAISRLIVDPQLRRELQENCRRLTSTGPLSTHARDRVLLPIYRELSRTPARISRGLEGKKGGIRRAGRAGHVIWPEPLCHWEIRRRTQGKAFRIKIE
jgi:glycosyltransferase involved in cell wall biosynthesis